MKKKQEKRAVDLIFYRQGRFYALFHLFSLFFLFQLFFVFTASANELLQNKRLTIQQKSTSIGKVLDEIEQKTGYFILVRDNDLNIQEKVSIDQKDQTLHQILTTLFRGKNVTYEIKNQTITIFKPEKIQSDSKKQNKRQIMGTVIDVHGEPIVGANIVEKGTTNGVITDVDGKFSLSIADNASLEISYIGYLPQSIPVKEQTVLSVTLKEDSQALDEVVVIGYGTMRKKDVTGSVVSADLGALKGSPNINILQGLQGTVPGLNVGMADEAGESGAAA